MNQITPNLKTTKSAEKKPSNHTNELEYKQINDICNNLKQIIAEIFTSSSKV
jgi:hypothetical protein